MKRILFYRDLQYFSGGHLKVFNYFQHALESPRYSPSIAFSDTSLWDTYNPWIEYRAHVTDWDLGSADVVFLAGMDWRFALAHGLRQFKGPVVNLIQHVRHADPTEALYEFLELPATRICVSQDVADAIIATQRVNGPVHTIANGIETLPLPAPGLRSGGEREPVLILGTKRTEFARELDDTLRKRGVATRLHDRFVSRDEFLALLGQHPIVVCCPDLTEGFYLPALEAMGRGALVICPDCVGNRGYCLNGQSCLLPAYTVNAMAEATIRARALSNEEFCRLRDAGTSLARSHSLPRESRLFLGVLDEITGPRDTDRAR